MKNIVCSFLCVLVLISHIASLAQSNDTSFFPSFQAYNANPIIKYGDGFSNAAWNDPVVLKENGQYIMYISAAAGFTGGDHVKIYRMLSSDGYSWTMSPSTSILEPSIGTYYEGGVETPSVVHFNNQYHMYVTVYPTNVAEDFVIAHATSPDGLVWQMDANPVLESDGSATWKGSIVGEPGAVVYHDSIYLFFTAAGVDNGTPLQCIGLMRSANGTTFDTPIQTAKIPQNVYPSIDNWWGLSTPSALAINDTLYLFTDVAKVINGNWTQAALHQFKSYGNLSEWYHDDAPIHTMEDFNWTNGDYLSELRSITPLMDDNGRLRIWYAGNRLADVSGTDTTYHITFDSLGGIHADPNYWGIGTSEYQFANTPNGINSLVNQSQISVYPNPAVDYVYVEGLDIEECIVYNCLGEIVMEHLTANNKINIGHLPNGTYTITSAKKTFHQRFVVIH